jgi:hypothetical protein
MDGTRLTNITSLLRDIEFTIPYVDLNDNGQLTFFLRNPTSGRDDVYLYAGAIFKNITANSNVSAMRPQVNNQGRVGFVGRNGQYSHVYLYNRDMVTDITPDLEANVYLDDLSLNHKGQIVFSDKYNIYLAQPNKPPIAEASNNLIVAPGYAVKPDGSGSLDPEGDSLSYRWLMVAKPVGSEAYLSDHTRASPILITDLTGIYEVQLIVSDGIDESRPDKVIITSTAPDQGPIAYAGSDQVVITGSTVILDGANSYSSGKDDLDYSWSLISKPEESKASLSNTGGNKCALSVDVDGIYEVHLIVNNDQSVSEPDTVTITALGQDSKIRVATNKAPYTSGDTLELYIWTGNATLAPEVKADVFMGIGFPNGRLYFFDPTLGLKQSDPNDPSTFIPFAQGATLSPGFIFATSTQMNADSDGNGKLDAYRLFSVTLPATLPLGEYFAFAALAETGTVQKGNPQTISKVSLSSFSFSP